MRGRDILTATPRQIYLYECLGETPPAYVHIPLLTDSQRRRLAKRDKDLGISALSKRFSPEEILGALAFASHLINKAKPVTLNKLILEFDWDRIPKEEIRLPENLA